MKTKRYIYLLLSIALFLSCERNNASNYRIFIKEYVNIDEGYNLNINIENNIITYSYDFPFSNTKKLHYRSLDIGEQKFLDSLIHKLNFDTLNNEYIDNRYYANFEYGIFIRNKSKSKSIYVFQNKLNKQLKRLINDIEKLKTLNNLGFDTVTCSLKGIADLTISSKVSKNDSILIPDYQSFNMWKSLMLYNNTIDSILYQDINDKIDFYLKGFYTLDYTGLKVNHIEVSKENVYIVYENTECIKLSRANTTLDDL